MRDDIYLVDVVVRAASTSSAPRSTTLRNLQVAAAERADRPARPVRLAAITARNIRLDLAARQRYRPSRFRPMSRPAPQAATVVSSAGPEDRGVPAEPADRVSHRHWRHGRGERQGAGLGFAVLPLMLLLTITILMIQLQSFSRLLLVLSVGPSGLIGVVAALLLLGQAAGLRRHPRHARPDGHDRPQLGDPDRPDREANRRRASHPGMRSSRPPQASPRPILLTALPPCWA